MSARVLRRSRHRLLVSVWGSASAPCSSTISPGVGEDGDGIGGRAGFITTAATGEDGRIRIGRPRLGTARVLSCGQTGPDIEAIGVIVRTIIVRHVPGTDPVTGRRGDRATDPELVRRLDRIPQNRRQDRIQIGPAQNQVHRDGPAIQAQASPAPAGRARVNRVQVNRVRAGRTRVNPVQAGRVPADLKQENRVQENQTPVIRAAESPVPEGRIRAIDQLTLERQSRRLVRLRSRPSPIGLRYNPSSLRRIARVQLGLQLRLSQNRFSQNRFSQNRRLLVAPHHSRRDPRLNLVRSRLNRLRNRGLRQNQTHRRSNRRARGSMQRMQMRAGCPRLHKPCHFHLPSPSTMVM